jgi:hypothetical protein
VLWALLAACGSGGGGPPPPDGDSDVDADADADTDADSDTDVDCGEAIVPEFGDECRTLVVVGTDADGLDRPTDLEFAPDHPDELWTWNAGISGVVLYLDAGSAAQSSEVRIDRYAEHFMDTVSSGAFGPGNVFATCQESRDDWNDAPQPEDDFMGPTLWLADLSVYAMVGQDFPWYPGMQEGSHIDMLHQSPLCMGIANDHDRVFWTFDGHAGNIVYYDFRTDHGPGGADHSDGIIRRYLDADVTRVAGVPGHMVVDVELGMLYVADTGSGRVMRLDTASGDSTGYLPGDWDGAEYTGVQNVTFDVFADGFGEPSGLALEGDRLFVTDHSTGEIVAYSLDGTELGRMETGAAGIMGVSFDPEGTLWYVDGDADELVRIDP